MTSPPLAPPLETDRWQPRYFTVFGGQALSLIGSALTQFVLIWWITKTTGSASALSVAGIMALLPQALLGPLGGTLADRYSRRVIMIVADAVSAVCMLVLIGLFASGQIQLWHVYTMMFIRSAMQAFQGPAVQASTAMLVPNSWLVRAAGLNQSLMGLMTVAAAPLGALALGFLPLQGALLIDVFTALLGIVPLFFWAIPQGRPDVVQSAWADFRQGLNLITGSPALLRFYLLIAAVVLVVMPTFTLTPLLVTRHFGLGVNSVALMEGLSGVGMIAGGLLATVIVWRSRIAAVLIAFAVSCAAVAFTALAPKELFWLAVLWWVVSGVAFSLGSAPQTAILQSIIPNHLQGRALSLLNTVMGLAGPVGLGLAAPLGTLIGVRGLFIWGGLLAAAVCLAGLFSKRLMRIETAPDLSLPADPISSDGPSRERA
jgi:MFS transporter, DHA3 family, macrolide efflux protein